MAVSGRHIIICSTRNNVQTCVGVKTGTRTGGTVKHLLRNMYEKAFGAASSSTPSHTHTVSDGGKTHTTQLIFANL